MKDPALLVYTKDFLEGTADLSAEEFGAYTRLIFHQHQRGFLPNDLKKLARLSGVSLSEFQEIWKEINGKFTLCDTVSGTGYVNKRCADEVTKRSLSATLKSIYAIFGNWVKSLEGIKKNDLDKIKKLFKAEDFIELPDEKKKEEILKFLNNSLKNLPKRNAKRSLTISANENEDGNANAIENINKNASAEIYPTGDDFWIRYDKKIGNETKIKELFYDLPLQTRIEIYEEHLPEYVKSTPNKKFRKNPQNYIEEEYWKNEIIINEQQKSNSKETGASSDFRRKTAERLGFK